MISTAPGDMIRDTWSDRILSTNKCSKLLIDARLFCLTTTEASAWSQQQPMMADRGSGWVNNHSSQLEDSLITHVTTVNDNNRNNDTKVIFTPRLSKKSNKHFTWLTGFTHQKVCACGPLCDVCNCSTELASWLVWWLQTWSHFQTANFKQK